MTCTHHWILGEGRQAHGWCRSCGEIRSFDGGNDLVDDKPEDDDDDWPFGQRHFLPHPEDDEDDS